MNNYKLIIGGLKIEWDTSYYPIEEIKNNNRELAIQLRNDIKFFIFNKFDFQFIEKNMHKYSHGVFDIEYLIYKFEYELANTLGYNIKPYEINENKVDLALDSISNDINKINDIKENYKKYFVEFLRSWKAFRNNYYTFERLNNHNVYDYFQRQLGILNENFINELIEKYRNQKTYMIGGYNGEVFKLNKGETANFMKVFVFDANGQANELQGKGGKVIENYFKSKNIEFSAKSKTLYNTFKENTEYEISENEINQTPNLTEFKEIVKKHITP